MEHVLIDSVLEFLQKAIYTPLFIVKETPITLSSLLVLVILIAIIVFASKTVKRIMLRKLFTRFSMAIGTQYTLARLTQYLVMSLGIIFAFQFVGIDLSGLTVIFGLLSVGIGFGLQNLTSNFVSGLIVMFERPIAVGDRVLVDDIEGDVTEINIRSTRIQSVNNISYIVPNTEFVSNTVVNYSHGEPDIKVDVEVGVSYSSDLELVKQTLYEIGSNHPEVNSLRNKPEVFLLSFGDSAWDMRLRVWIDNPKRKLYVLSDLNSAIVKKFREKSIEIPFPQRDLYVRGLSAPEWKGKE